MRLTTLQPQRKTVAASSSSSNVSQYSNFSRAKATMPRRKKAKRAMTPVGVTIIVNPLHGTGSLSLFPPSSFLYCRFVCFSSDFVFFFLFFFSLFFRCRWYVCVLYIRVCVCSPTSPRFLTRRLSVALLCEKRVSDRKGSQTLL